MSFEDMGESHLVCIFSLLTCCITVVGNDPLTSGEAPLAEELTSMQKMEQP